MLGVWDEGGWVYIPSLDLWLGSLYSFLPTTILLFSHSLFAVGCGSRVTLGHNKMY